MAWHTEIFNKEMPSRTFVALKQRSDIALTLSQTSPGFYMSAIQVF